MADEKRVTFRADPEIVSELEDELKLAQVDGRQVVVQTSVDFSDENTTRSDVLRQYIEDLRDELRSQRETGAEGNRTATTA